MAVKPRVGAARAAFPDWDRAHLLCKKMRRFPGQESDFVVSDFLACASFC
jgi:hypothetical protein